MRLTRLGTITAGDRNLITALIREELDMKIFTAILLIICLSGCIYTPVTPTLPSATATTIMSTPVLLSSETPAPTKTLLPTDTVTFTPTFTLMPSPTITQTPTAVVTPTPLVFSELPMLVSKSGYVSRTCIIDSERCSDCSVCFPWLYLMTANLSIGGIQTTSLIGITQVGLYIFPSDDPKNPDFRLSKLQRLLFPPENILYGKQIIVDVGKDDSHLFIAQRTKENTQILVYKLAEIDKTPPTVFELDFPASKMQVITNPQNGESVLILDEYSSLGVGPVAINATNGAIIARQLFPFQSADDEQSAAFWRDGQITIAVLLVQSTKDKVVQFFKLDTREKTFLLLGKYTNQEFKEMQHITTTPSGAQLVMWNEASNCVIIDIHDLSKPELSQVIPWETNWSILEIIPTSDNLMLAVAMRGKGPFGSVVLLNLRAPSPDSAWISFVRTEDASMSGNFGEPVLSIDGHFLFGAWAFDLCAYELPTAMQLAFGYGN
jgi:hypothetical protein